MAESRDDRWNFIDEKDPEGSIRLMRDILRDFEERLSGIDVNGGGLVIPDGYVTEAMLDDDAVGTSKIQPNAVTADKLNAEAVSTSKLADDAVTKAKLAGGFLGAAVIAGGTAGDHAVTGITTGDELVLVARLGMAFTELSAEFTISAADTINNAGGTDTTGDSLLVLYIDLT